MKHLDIIVRGKVQGVFFRASTRKKAQELGVCGQVSNQPDGSVEVHAEGGEEALDSLLDWLRDGPPQARVDEVIAREGEWLDYREFEIC